MKDAGQSVREGEDNLGRGSSNPVARPLGTQESGVNSNKGEPSHRARFGAFEVDLRSGELRKHGIKIKLQEKPFQILALLIEQPGEVVTREELQRRLWPGDTFVDFDRNLNTAANRLRQALGDSAENPRFIETIPRRGYRLIVPVEGNGTTSAQSAPRTQREAETISVNARIAVDRPGDGRARTILGGGGPAPREAGYKRSRVMKRIALIPAAVLLVAVAGMPMVRESVWATLEPVRERFGGRPGKMMLVVLPFENLSGDPQQDYFSDGLTEEMIAQVGRLNPERIGVIARTSAMHYRGTRKSLAEIGRELGVQYALEGSVRRFPARTAGGPEGPPLHRASRIRVAVQLVSVRDQSTLWSESYERPATAGDLFSIQQDVAANIASALAVELSTLGDPSASLRAGAEKGTPAGRPKAAPTAEAYEAYLLGRYYWNKRTSDGLYKGLEYFQRATEQDPGYAAAYAGIADTYLVLSALSLLPPQEAYPEAKAAALRALEIDPGLAEAQTSLAGVTFQYDWDWRRAEQQFQGAIALSRTRGSAYPTAHQWYAWYLSAMGRHQEALRQIETARRLDPLSLSILTTECTVHFQARRYDRALQACQRALELDRNFVLARVWLAVVYMKQAETTALPAKKRELYRRALEERSRAMIDEGYSPEEQESFRQAFATGGIKGARRWLINYRTQRVGPGGYPRHRGQYVPGYYMATLYGALGEKDKAFEWLERTYQQRDSFLTRLKVDPAIDDLRTDPRFQTFMERMKLK